MAASGGDIRERLSDLWAEWGMEPDAPTGAAQHQAVSEVAAWLEKGKTDPEIAIRATQILLADPERPGVNKRPAWVVLRKVLTDAWPNAGTAREHLSYAQALLLAAWPLGTQVGSLGLVLLFDSARQATTGLAQRQEAIHRWRRGIETHAPATEQPTDGTAPGLPQTGVTQFAGVKLGAAGALQHVQANPGHPQWQAVGAQVAQVLEDHRNGIAKLSEGLKLLSQEVSKHGQELAIFARDTVRDLVQNEVTRVWEESTLRSAQLELLWWGQARYCRPLATPYRRLMREGADVLLWWSAYEAAVLSLSLEIEPAAAYLVETLHGLDQDVFEKRPLGQWIEGLSTVLVGAGDKAPRVCNRLASLANSDALGLPVTWARLKAARKEPLADTAEDVALDLTTEIDRGEWASWVFREVLLDLHLVEEE